MKDDLGAADGSMRSLYLNSLLNRSICWLLGGVVVVFFVLYVLGKLRTLTALFSRHAPPPPPPLFG